VSSTASSHLLSRSHHLLLQERNIEPWRDLCCHRYCMHHVQDSPLQDSMLRSQIRVLSISKTAISKQQSTPSYIHCSSHPETSSCHAHDVLTVGITPSPALRKRVHVAPIAGVTISWNWAVGCTTAPTLCTLWTLHVQHSKQNVSRISSCLLEGSNAHLWCYTERLPSHSQSQISIHKAQFSHSRN